MKYIIITLITVSLFLFSCGKRENVVIDLGKVSDMDIVISTLKNNVNNDNVADIEIVATTDGVKVNKYFFDEAKQQFRYVIKENGKEMSVIYPNVSRECLKKYFEANNSLMNLAEFAKQNPPQQKTPVPLNVETIPYTPTNLSGSLSIVDNAFDFMKGCIKNGQVVISENAKIDFEPEMASKAGWNVSVYALQGGNSAEMAQYYMETGEEPDRFEPFKQEDDNCGFYPDIDNRGTRSALGMGWFNDLTIVGKTGASIVCNYPIMMAGCNDDKIENVKFSYSGNTGYEYGVLAFFNANKRTENIVFENCEIDCGKHIGLTFKEVKNYVFKNCVIKNSETNPIDAYRIEGEGMQFINCDFVDCKKPINLRKCKNVVFDNCRFSGFGGDFISFDGDSDIPVVKNCLFYANEKQYGSIVNTAFDNNTVIITDEELPARGIGVQ